MRRLGFFLLPLLLLLSQTVSAQINAIDLEGFDDESALYLLNEDGSLQTAGIATFYGSVAGIEAADLELTPSGTGYYILSADGRIHTFGDAVDYGEPALNQGEEAEKLVLGAHEEGYYILTNTGRIYPLGDVTFYGERIRSEAVDMALTPSGDGYYVLYSDGEIGFFGSATNLGFTTVSRTEAVALELQAQSQFLGDSIQGYFVLYSDGDIRPFGGVKALPRHERGGEAAVDLELSGRGYRILYANGQVNSFIQLDQQSPQRTAQDRASENLTAQIGQTQPAQEPTPTPLPTANYLQFEEDDFTETILGSLPVEQTVPESLTTGQLSLPSGGVYLVTADADTELARQIRYYPMDDGMSRDNTGELFATLNSERGSAFIRGISYSSQQGMVVTVVENEQTILLLVEGDFEPAGIQGFTQFEWSAPR